MEKKNYSKPTMNVVKVQPRKMICQSYNNGGEGYIPSMGSNELNKLA